MFRLRLVFLSFLALAFAPVSPGWAQVGPSGDPIELNPVQSSPPAKIVAAQSRPSSFIVIGLDGRHQATADWNLATGSQFADFRTAIGNQGYSYAVKTSFNASDLSGLSALVLFQPYTFNSAAEFTATEIAAIHNFVANGGGLFVIAEAGTGTSIVSLNQVVAPYGITYDTNSYDPTGRTITGFWYHPVTRGITTAKIDFQRGMIISPPALDMTVGNPGLIVAALATGGDDFLALREGDGGAGNCAFVTDSNIFSSDSTADAYIGSGDNLPLLKAIFDFIVKNRPYLCGVSIPALYYRATFESQTECWNFVSVPAAFAVPNSTRTDGALSLSPGGSAAAFGYWTSPPLDVVANGVYAIKWTLRSTTSKDRCPQFRVRVNDYGGRDSIFRAVESKGAGEDSPDGTDRVYYLAYDVPTGVTQITLSFDLLSFDSTDDLNSQVELREVSITPLFGP